MATQTFNSSKIWHSTSGTYDDNTTPLPEDYNDLVVIPKSILIDTADAIRKRCKGSTTVNVTYPDGVAATNQWPTYKKYEQGIAPSNFATTLDTLYLPSLAQKTDDGWGYGSAGNTGSSYSPKYNLSGSTIQGITLGSNAIGSDQKTWKKLWTVILCPAWWNDTSTGGYKGPCVMVFSHGSAINAARNGETYFCADAVMSCGSPTSSTYSFGQQLGYPLTAIKLTDVLPACEGGNDTAVTSFNFYRRAGFSSTTYTSKATNSKFGINSQTGRYAPCIYFRTNSGLT